MSRWAWTTTFSSTQPLALVLALTLGLTLCLPLRLKAVLLPHYQTR